MSLYNSTKFVQNVTFKLKIQALIKIYNYKITLSSNYTLGVLVIKFKMNTIRILALDREGDSNRSNCNHTRHGSLRPVYKLIVQTEFA